MGLVNLINHDVAWPYLLTPPRHESQLTEHAARLLFISLRIEDAEKRDPIRDQLFNFAKTRARSIEFCATDRIWILRCNWHSPVARFSRRNIDWDLAEQRHPQSFCFPFAAAASENVVALSDRSAK